MKLYAQSRIALSGVDVRRRTYELVCALLLVLAVGSAAIWWTLWRNKLEVEKSNAELRATLSKSSRESVIGDADPASTVARLPEFASVLAALRFDWNEEFGVLDRLSSSGVRVIGWTARRDSDDRQLILTADSTGSILEAVAAINADGGHGRWYVAQIAEAPSTAGPTIKAIVRRRP